VGTFKYFFPGNKKRQDKSRPEMITKKNLCEKGPGSKLRKQYFTLIDTHRFALVGTGAAGQVEVKKKKIKQKRGRFC